VLTDLVMPRMRGTELVERLRGVRPDLRILLMSGYAKEPIVLRLGHDSMVLLLKPFTSVELVKRVRQVLDAPWEGITTRLNA
jgi:CheY-like chemotaxis protein